MKKQLNIIHHSRRKFITLAAFGAASVYVSCLPGKETSGLFKDSDKEKFLKACENGELEMVEELLSKNQVFLNTKDDLGRSAFAIALLSGHQDIGGLLKEKGYETDLHETVLELNWDHYNEMIGEKTVETEKRVNTDHPIGGTLMWAAAAGGAGKQIWRVYANGGNPNINTRHKKGSTPLQKALRFPDLKIAELTAASLLSNDTDPNPAPNAEIPPLHIAAERGSYEMTEMLIRLGANVNAKDQDGRTAARLADYSGHRSVYELLVNHKQVPQTCRTSRSTFDLNLNPYEMPDMKDIPQYLKGNFVGSAHRNLEALQKAVADDPRMVHSAATTSEMGVEAGAHMGRKDIVEYLLKNGAPYSMPTAVLLDDFISVKRMLAEDPNRIYERGAHDFALLWYPIIGRNGLDVLQLLLDHGAEIEEQHFMGTTALHFAAIGGNIEAVEFLLENGADINRKGRKFSEQPLSPLELTKNEKVADYLRSKGAK